MKILYGKSLFILLLLVGSATLAWGQTISAGPDSTVVPSREDTTKVGFLNGLKNLDKPGRAALYSAIIPGGGQIYNKSYWKAPIVLAGAATIGYFIAKWHKQYLIFRSSYAALTDGNPNTVDRFVERWPDEVTRARNISLNEQQFRRYRDLNIFYAAVLYGLNITEAYVHAHLKDFDVSDELTLRVQPAIIPGPAFRYAPGVSVQFNLNK